MCKKKGDTEKYFSVSPFFLHIRNKKIIKNKLYISNNE